MISTMTNIKTYSDLIKLPTFEERFEYLKLNGVVSELTFGSERYLIRCSIRQTNGENYGMKLFFVIMDAIWE